MKKTLIYFILILLTFSSCKKEQDLPEQISEVPVFYLNYTLDGIDQRLEAGNYDYFMNTSWTQDSNHVYVLKGDLSQASNTASKSYAISILLNDDKTSLPNAGMQVDNILKIGQHLLNDKYISGTTQTLLFIADKPFDAASSYLWQITDGNADVRSVSAYSFSAEYSLGKTYSVSLTYNDGLGGCITTHSNVFRVGNKLQTKITAKRDTTSPEFKYIFSYPKPYSGSFSCAWKFEDGATSSMKSPSHLFIPGSTSIVSLMLVDLSTLDTCYSYYQLNATNNAVCDANYSAFYSPVINTSIFSTATVLLTDVDGTVYSSRNAIQPSTSNFEILSVSEYKTNANGYPTKSLNLKFNCVLKNGNQQKTLTNATGIMAVAYKP